MILGEKNPHKEDGENENAERDIKITKDSLPKHSIHLVKQLGHFSGGYKGLYGEEQKVCSTEAPAVVRLLQFTT